MTDIQLYSPKNLPNLSFPDTEEGQYTKNFLEAFMNGSTKQFISNIDTEMYCLKIDDHFFPITINDTEYDNSYVTSPYGFIVYTEEELKRFNHWLLTPLMRPILKGTGALLKWGKINRVVTVNNWLLSTNLFPELSKEQIEAATTLLKEIFPSHTILWRSLNNTTPKGLINNFKKLPYRLIFSRQVYFYDPMKSHSLNSKKRWNIKSDQKLLQTSGYEIVNGEKLETQDIPRIQELYASLYLEKYTPLNPQFTEEFIRLALEKKLLNILAIRKNGIIDGVIGYFKRGNVMTTPLVGYDTKLPQEIGLYRMLTVLCIKEAHLNQLLLHHSSGVSHFKRIRGMYPDLEYTAVFDKHLPKRRRIIWSVLETLLNRIGRPFLTYFKL